MAKQEKTKISWKDIKVGRWVRVKWDDIGVRDCVVVEIDGSKYAKYTRIRCFEVGENRPRSVFLSQIEKVGNMIAAKDSGL